MAPPLRLLRLGNPFVRTLLDSPAHRLLSGSLVVLEYDGRRTGLRRRIPVMAAPDDDGHLVVLAVAPGAKHWWRTFDPAGAASVVVRRERRTVEGRLLEDRGERRDALRSYLRRFPRAASRLGVDAAGEDSALDEVDAAVVRFTPLPRATDG